MALPTETLRRWNIADGGTVEVADLGAALIIVPAGAGDFVRWPAVRLPKPAGTRRWR